MRIFVSLALAGALASSALADTQFSISELMFNPPGTDQGQEFLEIRGPASTALTGIYFLAIDGDAGSSGTVDQSTDLSSFSTGTNGLLLIRDTGTTLLPAPDVATGPGTFDWTPDIENGTNTYVLASGTQITTGTDLDTNDDGTLDAAFSMTVIDVVTHVENDPATNNIYADDLGGETLGPWVTGGSNPSAFNASVLMRLYNSDGPCSWVAALVPSTTVSPGPYPFDFAGDHVFGAAAAGLSGPLDASPGNENVVADHDADGLSNLCDGCPHDPAKGAPGSCGCGVAEGCSLGIDIDEISALAGGTQVLSLHGGAGFGGFGYFILGSASGTVPGIQVNPNVHLDLNFDFYFNLLASAPNTLIIPSLGFLDGAGEATASWTLPGGFVILGSPLTLRHAYLIYYPPTSGIQFASNTTPLLLNP